jgi:hypothetical protein
MKKVLAAVFLVLAPTYSQTALKETRSRIILPNPDLLRCKSLACSQTWLEKSEQPNAVFPKQVIIDMNQDCLYGFTALYDSSIPLDEIRNALDDRYGKWAVSLANPLNVWRIEPDKFAIQLSVADKNDQKRHIAEAGTKQVIYIAFGGRSACNSGKPT